MEIMRNLSLGGGIGWMATTLLYVKQRVCYVFPELSDVEVRLAEHFLSVLEIDFWYDRSTSTVIRQRLQPPLVVTRRIFSKCLAN